MHVHIYDKHAEAVSNYLLFRDQLRTDEGDRALYAQTKHELVKRGFDDMNAYSDAKTDVVLAILGRARARRQ